VRGAGDDGQPPQVVENAHAADRVGDHRPRLGGGRERAKAEQVRADEGAGETQRHGHGQLHRVRAVRAADRGAQGPELGDGRAQPDDSRAVSDAERRPCNRARPWAFTFRRRLRRPDTQKTSVQERSTYRMKTQTHPVVLRLGWISEVVGIAVFIVLVKPSKPEI